jgi:hypothetical protein
MEDFFTPTRRLAIEPLGFAEVQLAVSVEAFLDHSWDWSDLYAFVTGDEGAMRKCLWITEGTIIWVEDENNALEFEEMVDYSIQRATFMTPSGETHTLFLAKSMKSASLSAEASGVFWHAVTTSNCVKLRVEHWSGWFIVLCSGATLLQFLENSPSLELLEFEAFAFEEAHCRALATLERTNLKITFEGCSFDAQNAKGTFIEWLRHSQVVTKLERCKMEHIIISALTGNSSVKSLSIDATTNAYRDSHILSLARALPGNQGIENLSVSLLSAKIWSLLLRSLWAHPRIQSVKLSFIPEVSAASKASIMVAVLRLVQCNTVVHTIELPDHAKDEEFFQSSIVPRLEMNRRCFEDQRQALTRADPSIRGQLLGRALHVVRSNPALLFRLLSENVPAFVLLEEDDPVIPCTWCCLLRGT